MTDLSVKDMVKAMEKRASRRNYKNDPISIEDMEKIQFFVDECNKDSGLTCTVLEDGSAGFRSAKKTYGMFSNVRTVILLKGNPDMDDFSEKVGYYGERLMLCLVSMGLGTCWVGGTFDREAYTVPSGERIECVLTVGNISKPGVKDSMMMQMNHVKRKPMSERIDSDLELPLWVQRGMEAVILAPSAVNRQKPHYFLQGRNCDGRGG